MHDIYFFYGFMALMLGNLLASFLYLMGLRQAKAVVVRAYCSYRIAQELARKAKWF